MEENALQLDQQLRKMASSPSKLKAGDRWNLLLLLEGVRNYGSAHGPLTELEAPEIVRSCALAVLDLLAALPWESAQLEAQDPVGHPTLLVGPVVELPASSHTEWRLAWRQGATQIDAGQFLQLSPNRKSVLLYVGDGRMQDTLTGVQIEADGGRLVLV
jgi:hypothetical protein